ncbi:MAG: type VI secretion system tip protein VgrG [Planctomycetes bacterium]|nr:type VI secretion system tip protein VgrG [Planctomycetota bacterium]
MGQSNCPRLAPGLTFELAEHPHQALNGSYLVTSVLHSGKQAVVRTSSGPNGRAGLLDHRLHQSLLTARQDREGTTREFAEALLQLIARLHRGDETAHRVWGQWLYHAGQVLGDLAAVAGALGAKPLEAIAAPGLLEESGRAGRGSLVNDDAPVYECRFECIPAAVTYRPARVSRWPVMRGSQTARVVGPAGEAIHCDKFGRVKVQFHWDREGKHDENSSCWIRVSHGMAGGAYGHLFLPRVGQEVIVDFLEGDPDQPIITGRVYNADHMPAYPLPEEKTKSYIKTHSSKGGGGTNEIRFEDLKDKEQILIHAQKDLHVRVTSDEVETVERDRHLSVGNDKVEQVGRDKSVRVKGKESYQVDGTLSVTCGGDVVEKLSANHKHEVTETYLCKAMSICLDAAQEIELKCGGSSIVLTPAAVFIVGGPLVNIDSGAGPPVSPVSASATAPVEPGTADDVTPGKDTTYSGGEELAEAESPSEVAGWEFEPAETKEKEASWIDISLVNEAAEPIPGARYRVVDSAGKVKEGTLDANGRAHVAPIEPGPCEVSFPDYDGPAWRKGTGSAVRDEPTEAFEEPLPLADDTRCDNVSPRPWEAEQQEATLEAEREAANQDEEGDDSQLP